MKTIKLLDQELVAKIAAGEVIDRPASVVKELLENALDASATKITIRIQEGGKKQIIVQDNGKGISKEELSLALKRHATSKISTVEDLFNLHTLGFRGEALASIDAVSITTVISKPKTQNVAAKIVNNQITAAAHEDGTTIVVDNLFDKLPARKKYLKSITVEQKAIVQLVHNYALANPQVAFHLYIDDEMEIAVQISANHLERAKSLYATQGKHLIGVKSSHPSQQYCTVKGICSLPSLTKNSRKDMIIFCNNRLIQSAAIHASILHAYKGSLPQHTYPVCILFLTIDPREIDVNVHPAKTTIQFHEESKIYQSVYHALQDSLQSQNLMQSIEAKNIQTVIADSSQKNNNQNNSKVSTQNTTQTTAHKDYGFSTQQQKTLPVVRETYTREELEQNSPQFKILDIINKTFVVASFAQGLTITDFHAAYERLNYEIFKKQYENKSISTQKLISPIVREVSQHKKKEIFTQTTLLESFGITVEDFGPGLIAIHTLPSILGRTVDESIIDELIDDIETITLHKKIDDIITRMSCKASPRAGDTISHKEAEDLIKQLYTNQLHWTCPHGRPVMVLITPQELAKLFKR